MADAQPEALVAQLARVAEEDLAEDPVGQRLEERIAGRPQGDVPVAVGGDVADDHDRSAEDDGDPLEGRIRPVPDRPGEDAVLERELGLDERHGRR